MAVIIDFEEQAIPSTLGNYFFLISHSVKSMGISMHAVLGKCGSFAFTPRGLFWRRCLGSHSHHRKEVPILGWVPSSEARPASDYSSYVSTGCSCQGLRTHSTCSWRDFCLRLCVALQD